MKSYGHARYEKIICKYGCCTLRKGNKHSIHRVTYDRRAAKRARQASRKECESR